MRIFRFALFLLILGFLLAVVMPGVASAATPLPRPGGSHGGGGYHGGGYHGGYGHYGHGYYRHGYYPYWGYYRPYYYSPFYWGWGYGWGWGGYAYPYYYAPGAVYYGYGGGEVRTEIKPQSAKVFVDGGYAGVSDDYDGWWQRLNLEPGRHRLVFREQGFAPYVVDLNVQPGGDYHLKYGMAPGDDVISDSEMRLKREDYDNDYGRRYRNDDNYREDRYDDRYRNNGRDDQYQRYPDPYNRNNNGGYPPSDETYNRNNNGGYPPPDDNYNRERSNEPDGNWEQQRPSQRQGSSTSSAPIIEQDITNDKREITLEVQPTDATVYIDGTYYGTTGNGGHVKILLPDGSHRVEVVRPGYESFEKELTVNATSPTSLTVMLQKK